MQQLEMPMYECVEDALKDAVRALGGAKAVGRELWPDKDADAAGRKLLDALNPSRDEKLEYTQIMLIFRMARDKGCYSPFRWFALECGFDAHPVTRADEVDRATAVVESAARALQLGLATLERLQTRGGR